MYEKITVTNVNKTNTEPICNYSGYCSMTIKKQKTITSMTSTICLFAISAVVLTGTLSMTNASALPFEENPLTITNPGNAAGSEFGISLASHGDKTIVGAFKENNQQGAAYLFETSTGNVIHSFQKQNPVNGDWFGFAVSLSDKYVLVGSPQDQDTGNTGAAYLYDVVTGQLLWTFTNPNPVVGDFYGVAVSVDGDNVLIGAFKDDTDGNNGIGSDIGIAYLYDATTGNLLDTFHNPTPSTGDQFGRSVMLHGNNALIGSQYANEVYLFDITTGNLVQTFLNPTGNGLDWFGYAIFMNSNNVLVGSFASDPVGVVNAGTAYLFDITTANLLQTFDNPEPEANDEFGISVSLKDNHALVSARNDKLGSGSPFGAAYLFDTITGDSIQTFERSTPEAGSLFGEWVALSEDGVVIGSRQDDLVGGNAGAVYVFKPDTTMPPEPEPLSLEIYNFYVVSAEEPVNDPVVEVIAYCDEGDAVVSGGFRTGHTPPNVFNDRPIKSDGTDTLDRTSMADGWYIKYRHLDTNFASTVGAVAVCADLTP